MLLVGLMAVSLPLYRPEWALDVLFFGVVMTTDAVDGRNADFFAIPDADLIQGLPPLLTSYFLFLFAVYFSHRLIRRRTEKTLSWKPLAVWVAVVALAGLTGLLRGNDPMLLRVDGMNMLFPILCFYLVRQALDTEERATRMLLVVATAAAIKSVILLAYYWAGRGWLYSAVEEGSYRIATMDSADLLSMITVLLLIFAGWSCRRFRGGWWVAAVVALLPLALMVVFADRRAQWVGLVLSMLLLLTGLDAPARRRMFGAGGMMLFLLACAVVFSGVADSKLARLGRRSLSILDAQQDSNRYHLLESQQTLRDIARSPVLGLGLGGRHASLGLYDEDEVPDNIVHNAWLYVWMKLGLPGLVFLLWAVGRWVKVYLRYRRETAAAQRSPWALALVSSGGLWLAMSLTGPVPWYFHQTYLIALFAGLSLALMQPERAAKKI